ncbi:sensor histidine kinase [Bacillus tuaregi]|uniref:sensor histidine kinase n=1 Tax=Bacillus tuaregi TaxID=1816695 RepID=UPI0009FE9F10|nr:sensor histidine kinase [Bacillus tuaregi]
MDTSIEMLIRLFERATLILICLFFLLRIPRFRATLQRDKYSPFELFIITLFFILFAIFGTYSGIEVEGSLVNTRIIAVVSGGVLFGPWVGITTGIVSGLHRYLIDIGGVTSIPCLITTILAGVLSGYIHQKTKKSLRWMYGILAGVLSEVLTMLLIIVMADSYEVGMSIVSKIAFPMIMGEVNIGFIVLMIMKVESDKAIVAAKQAKLALNIANKTLPYFRSINSVSLEKICLIIKDEIKADAVAITDTNNVLAYAGVGRERYKIGGEIISERTISAIKNGEITFSKNPSNLYNLIIPLKIHDEVTGTLKIYYLKEYKMTYPLQIMAIGLSQIISTLMEVSRVEQIKAEAKKAELNALQTKINPHFLFNALNAIASTTRKDPQKARELIISLSSYMRYNLELTDDMIDMEKELQQVKDYVVIEKARFGSRLQVEYDIDEVDLKIPSLLIQPLVENAIKHGVLKTKEPGVVTISVKDNGGVIRISVKDTGVGIAEEVIENLYQQNVPANKIGLFNVYQRVKLIYGKELVIHRLNPGTEVYFDIEREIS